MDKLLDLKKVIEEKLENAKNDLIGTKYKINEVYGKADNVGYIDTDIIEQCRNLGNKIERLNGECEAYIDILRTIEYMEVK